ncbi:uro-adherence factor A-like [Parasteatoda tepidariorum]|uniref:uro-adherence factor A-like n=1 Tax=Parasteatoda tepidariorum TaxID=114398 RepID=UPI0039BC5890
MSFPLFNKNAKLKQKLTQENESKLSSDLSRISLKCKVRTSAREKVSNELHKTANNGLTRFKRSVNKHLNKFINAVLKDEDYDAPTDVPTIYSEQTIDYFTNKYMHGETQNDNFLNQGSSFQPIEVPQYNESNSNSLENTEVLQYSGFTFSPSSTTEQLEELENTNLDTAERTDSRLRAETDSAASITSELPQFKNFNSVTPRTVIPQHNGSYLNILTTTELPYNDEVVVELTDIAKLIDITDAYLSTLDAEQQPLFNETESTTMDAREFLVLNKDSSMEKAEEPIHFNEADSATMDTTEFPQIDETYSNTRKAEEQPNFRGEESIMSDTTEFEQLNQAYSNTKQSEEQPHFHEAEFIIPVITEFKQLNEAYSNTKQSEENLHFHEAESIIPDIDITEFELVAEAYSSAKQLEEQPQFSEEESITPDITEFEQLKEAYSSTELSEEKPHFSEGGYVTPDTEHFLQLDEAYQMAPKVEKLQLYSDTESVMSTETEILGETDSDTSTISTVLPLNIFFSDMTGRSDLSRLTYINSDLPRDEYMPHFKKVDLITSEVTEITPLMEIDLEITKQPELDDEDLTKTSEQLALVVSDTSTPVILEKLELLEPELEKTKQAILHEEDWSPTSSHLDFIAVDSDKPHFSGVKRDATNDPFIIPATAYSEEPAITVFVDSYCGNCTSSEKGVNFTEDIISAEPMAVLHNKENYAIDSLSTGANPLIIDGSSNKNKLHDAEMSLSTLKQNETVTNARFYTTEDGYDKIESTTSSTKLSNETVDSFSFPNINDKSTDNGSSIKNMFYDIPTSSVLTESATSQKLLNVKITTAMNFVTSPNEVDKLTEISNDSGSSYGNNTNEKYKSLVNQTQKEDTTNLRNLNEDFNTENITLEENTVSVFNVSGDFFDYIENITSAENLTLNITEEIDESSETSENPAISNDSENESNAEATENSTISNDSENESNTETTENSTIFNDSESELNGTIAFGGTIEQDEITSESEYYKASSVEPTAVTQVKKSRSLAKSAFIKNKYINKPLQERHKPHFLNKISDTVFNDDFTEFDGLVSEIAFFQVKENTDANRKELLNSPSKGYEPFLKNMNPHSSYISTEFYKSEYPLENRQQSATISGFYRKSTRRKFKIRKNAKERKFRTSEVIPTKPLSKFKIVETRVKGIEYHSLRKNLNVALMLLRKHLSHRRNSTISSKSEQKVAFNELSTTFLNDSLKTSLKKEEETILIIKGIPSKQLNGSTEFENSTLLKKNTSEEKNINILAWIIVTGILFFIAALVMAIYSIVLTRKSSDNFSTNYLLNKLEDVSSKIRDNKSENDTMDVKIAEALETMNRKLDMSVNLIPFYDSDSLKKKYSTSRHRNKLKKIFNVKLSS